MANVKQAITYGGTHGSFGWMLFASNEADRFKELISKKIPASKTRYIRQNSLQL